MKESTRKIRVIHPPIGEAPPWVRQAWVGLELPVARKPRAYRGFGVLTGPRSYFSQLWSLLGPKAERITGFPVYARDAVQLLAASEPKAANWWRENAPHLLRP